MISNQLQTVVCVLISKREQMPSIPNQSLRSPLNQALLMTWRTRRITRVLFSCALNRKYFLLWGDPIPLTYFRSTSSSSLSCTRNFHLFLLVRMMPMVMDSLVEWIVTLPMALLKMGQSHPNFPLSSTLMQSTPSHLRGCVLQAFSMDVSTTKTSMLESIQYQRWKSSNGTRRILLQCLLPSPNSTCLCSQRTNCRYSCSQPTWSTAQWTDSMHLLR
mmetsp:Transcript_2226/g.8190  ORF Transcript_2226/g.8190 Transcript_2226/m.8190 type:complete len:217 (+) Transcript_2226:1639-2289(+)